MSSSASWKLCVTWPGSKGAPSVTTAREGDRRAAFSTAAPPSECPISSAGAMPRAASASAARTRSSTFDVKEVLRNSPPECPSPVKSKRRTAMPSAVRRCAIRRAATMSLPQVKQWAKSAVARCGPSGRSSRAASASPPWPAKVKRSVGMGLLRQMPPRMGPGDRCGNPPETPFTASCGKGRGRDRVARDPPPSCWQKTSGGGRRPGAEPPDYSHE
jgi:hypothetical protein